MMYKHGFMFIFIGMLHYICVSTFIDVVVVHIYVGGDIVVLKCVFNYN